MNDSVSSFMVGNHLPFLLLKHHGTPLLAVSHLVSSGLQIRKADRSRIALSAKDSSLINQICEIGSGHAWGSLSDHVQSFRRLGNGFAFGVAFEDSSPTSHIRVGHIDLSIETPRPQQSFVEILRTIGSSDNHDSLAALKTIHRR